MAISEFRLIAEWPITPTVTRGREDVSTMFKFLLHWSMDFFDGGGRRRKTLANGKQNEHETAIVSRNPYFCGISNEQVQKV